MIKHDKTHVFDRVFSARGLFSMIFYGFQMVSNGLSMVERLRRHNGGRHLSPDAPEPSKASTRGAPGG